MICRVKELDGRKLDHKALEAIRMRAVKQVVAGESPETVIKALGFTRCCIYNWISKYKKGGWGALKAVTLTGRTPLLLRQTKSPPQLHPQKCPMSLWDEENSGAVPAKHSQRLIDGNRGHA